MTMQVSGTTGWTFPDNSSQATAASGFGFKNRIINGACIIDQRNAGASKTLTNGADTFSVDRWKFYRDVGGTFTAQQSTTVPAGFKNSMLVTASTGASPSASALNFLVQPIEGLNCADLGFGAAGASTVTVSFWIRSSITGDYAVTLANNAADRCYVTTVTVNSANTFEYKTITIAGDTSGTWLTDTNSGLRLYIDLGSGSNYNGTANTWNAGTKLRTSGSTTWGATTGATLYLTGVQLEKGSTATSFDYRPYGTELQLCQRYYNKLLADSAQVVGLNGFFDSATVGLFYYYYPVVMRTEPTLTTTGTATDYYLRKTAGATTNCSVVPSITGTSTTIARIQGTVASGLTGGQGGALIMSTVSSYLGFNAEL